MNVVLVSIGRGVRRFASPDHSSTFTRLAFVMAASALLSIQPSQAVPYATSLTNDNSTISFRLNEAADNVQILQTDGTLLQGLGPLPAGLHTVNASVTGAFKVSVSRTSPVGFTAPVAPNQGATLQISDDGSTTRYNNPRGLAVNTDPTSPSFGRVYVANVASGTAVASGSTPERIVGDGIYVMNADLSDAVGQGDEARNGGIPFITGGASGDTASPFRLSIGQDGNLYVADWSDAGGTLWVTDADVSSGSGANVLGGPVGGPFPLTDTRIHGSIAAAIVEGSLAGGDLTAYVIDEDLQDDRATTSRSMNNTLWRHDVGGALPGAEVLPTRIGSTTPWINFASQTMDLSRGTNGNFYVNDYRSGGTDRGGLYVIAPDGTELWNSLSATRALVGSSTAPDFLRATGGGAISPDGNYAAVINIETNGITIVPLVDGLPDIANRLALSGFNTVAGQGRDVAFDLAGNLYAISSGAQSLRVFSPGGTTTTITGSEGTFEVIRPSSVSVVATDELATEGADTATFTISRTGDTGSDLTVFYTLEGTAINGTDYQTNELSVVIPSGFASIDITITPVDDTEIEPTENARLTVLADSTYDVKAPVLADVFIADNEAAVVTIRTLDANSYERFPTDTLTFLIERAGETNSELFVVYEPNDGVAVNGVDFQGTDGQPLSGVVILVAGQSSQTVAIAPIDDSEIEGDETVTLSLSGTDGTYTLGTPSSASGIIADNDQPSLGVLYADSFDTDTSADWITRFAANNGILDAEVIWGFDYSTIGIPAAPNSPLTTLGVFVQVNKLDATSRGSAGINLYPAGRKFSGNYSLRFDMLLNYGTASTTEHALAGLNHSSERTNRVTLSTNPEGHTRGGDGLFVAMISDGSNNRDWTAYTFPTETSTPTAITNRTAASLASVITAPPYGAAGAVGNSATSAKTWAEIELSQNNDVVTLKVNNNVIYSFVNTSGFTSGDIMIGMSDQFDSVGTGGTAGNFVIFDNVRVLTLDARITGVLRLGNGDIQIDFVSPFEGGVEDYTLQSASSLSALDWADETTAVITATAEGFRCVVPANGPERFYRIKR